MLHLERKARPKIDDFVLDLKAFARVETVVGASRAIAFRWASTLRQRRGVELGEHVLDLMKLVRPATNTASAISTVTTPAGP